MTQLKFYSGLREIGGTFVEVETETTKCMFDFGFAVASRMDEKMRMRPQCAAADYVTLGILPAAAGSFDKKTAEKLGNPAFGELEKECFFVISHMHIDHMGGLGMLDPGIPVYMSADSLKLYRCMAADKDVQYPGEHKNCIGIPYGESFTVGDITVTVLAIDHDVVGASGFLIQTPSGQICYTGDYRFHGFHPERTESFAQRAAGSDVLITEGVTVSYDDVDMLALEEPTEPSRTEETLQEEIRQVCSEQSGLIVINTYPRNVERMYRMIESCAQEGRTLVLDAMQAEYVSAFYAVVDDAVYEETWHFGKAERGLTSDEGLEVEKEGGWTLVSRAELLENPGKYVLQLFYEDFYELIDLKDVVSLYIHADGAPLGDYDPSFAKMKATLETLDIPYEYKGTGGHAKPWYLRHMVDTIAPKKLIPLHSFRPEQVMSEKAGERILPAYGDVVIL
ncbi:MAG: MBL fold metallo-hydrolase [Lachnospiraceae bacterium]|nr:MBL fold metallo-hydrolase [Lachnospiraceae bacterium]